MQKEQQELANLIKGKKVAFIGAGVSHKTLIKEFVELGAHVTLCDQKKSVEDFGDYAATIKELGIDLSLGENYLDGFKGQDIIMRTPGFVGYFEKPLQDAMAAGTKVTIYDKAKVAAGEPLETVKGAELSGKDNILFIRNSVSGRIEARYRKTGIELNEKLHKN